MDERKPGDEEKRTELEPEERKRPRGGGKDVGEQQENYPGPRPEEWRGDKGAEGPDVREEGKGPEPGPGPAGTARGSGSEGR